jgi:prepilin-type N-terminal cleavage/methylation domain-containing protein
MRRQAVTLMELLVAIVLISVIILGFSNIDLFSRWNVLTSDRRAKAQNEASYVLEHIGRDILSAIGNERIDGAGNVVNISTASGVTLLRFFVDSDASGVRDSASDYWSAYSFTASGGDAYKLRHCRQCADATCGSCTTGWETLSSRITQFTPSLDTSGPGSTLADNLIVLKVISCWDITDASTCGSRDNPSVTMQSRAKMPSVSVN